MSGSKGWRLLPLAVLPVMLMACSHSGSASSAASSAAPKISALASDPALIGAEKAWGPKLSACYAKQPHHILHPFVALQGAVTCAAADLTPAQRKAAETCAVAAAIKNGAGTGKAKQDLDLAAECLAQQAGTASPSPSTSP